MLEILGATNGSKTLIIESRGRSTQVRIFVNILLLIKGFLNQLMNGPNWLINTLELL